MSAVWTKEMYLKTVPDSVFPCSTEARLLSLSENLHTNAIWHLFANGSYDQYVANNERDALGRCQLKCANCNCRMLFNQLECVKADLETTKETLQETKDELHSVKSALEECNKERDEEKRRFSIAIAKMVESELSDVRTQLSALNLCLKEELGEKALEKKAASEAAKAALSASKFITLRLLMF